MRQKVLAVQLFLFHFRRGFMLKLNTKTF